MPLFENYFDRMQREQLEAEMAGMPISEVHAKMNEMEDRHTERVTELKCRIVDLEEALRDLVEPTPEGEAAKRWSEKIRRAQELLRK